MKAITPISPPSASEPVSPMKTSAGCELYHKKAMQPPISAPQITVSSPVPGTWLISRYSEMNILPAAYAMMPNTSATEIVQPTASPSSPSVKLIALLNPTIHRYKSTSNNTGDICAITGNL